MRHTLLTLAALTLLACTDDATGPVTSFAPDATTTTDAGTDTTTAPDISVPDATTPDSSSTDAADDTLGSDVSAPDSATLDATPTDATEPDAFPQSLCTGPFDSEPMEDREGLQTLAWECLVDCGRDVGPEDVLSCTQLCVDDGSELTPGCASCHAELAYCASGSGCTEECAADPTGWQCAYCLEECAAGFEECSGVEAWRTEGVCLGDAGWSGAVRNTMFCYREEPDELDECLDFITINPDDFADESCADCATFWAFSLPAECPACVDSFESAECTQCIAGSESRRAASFCAGVAPTAP